MASLIGGGMLIAAFAAIIALFIWIAIAERAEAEAAGTGMLLGLFARRKGADAADGADGQEAAAPKRRRRPSAGRARRSGVDAPPSSPQTPPSSPQTRAQTQSPPRNPSIASNTDDSFWADRDFDLAQKFVLKENGAAKRRMPGPIGMRRSAGAPFGERSDGRQTFCADRDRNRDEGQRKDGHAIRQSRRPKR